MFPVEIPLADYDDTDKVSNGNTPSNNPTPDKYRHATEDLTVLNAKNNTSPMEEDVVVAQPVMIEGDRSKAGLKRRSQMHVASIRLDSESDSNTECKFKLFDLFCCCKLRT